MDQEVCGAGDETSRDDTRELYWTTSQVELYETRLEAVVGGQSRKTGRRLRVSGRRFV